MTAVIEKSQEWVDKVTSQAVEQSDLLRTYYQITVGLAAAWGGSVMGTVVISIYAAWLWPADEANLTIHNWVYAGAALLFAAINVWGFGRLGAAKIRLWQIQTSALSSREILGMTRTAHTFIVTEASRPEAKAAANT